MNDLWDKYRLSLDGAWGLMYPSPDAELPIDFTEEEVKSYINMAISCHDAVSSYWEANPGSHSLGYYKTLKLASPTLDRKVHECSVEYRQRVQKMHQLRNSASHDAEE